MKKKRNDRPWWKDAGSRFRPRQRVRVVDPIHPLFGYTGNISPTTLTAERLMVRMDELIPEAVSKQPGIRVSMNCAFFFQRQLEAITTQPPTEETP